MASCPRIPQAGQVLVLEPDHLTRWSIEAYLANRLNVLSADSVDAAEKLLDAHAVNAVIISNDLPNGGADQIEAHARRRNPGVSVVRTVTEPAQMFARSRGSICLEKPFSLAELGRLLGVAGR